MASEHDKWLQDVIGIGSDVLARPPAGAAVEKFAASMPAPGDDGQGADADPNSDHFKTKPQLKGSSAAASFKPGGGDDAAEPQATSAPGGGDAASAPGGGDAAGGPSLGDIVSAGQLAYTILKDNKPSMEANSAINYALPKNPDGELQEAKGTKQMDPAFVLVNLVNVNTVDLVIHISWRYGIAVKNKGAFINDAYITMGGSVLWGYTVNAKVQYAKWEIRGSAKSPIAVLPFHIDVTVSTLIKQETFTGRGWIAGDGSGRLDWV